MKSIKRRITVLVLVIVLVLSQLIFASAVEADYAGHWAQPAIEKWYNNGIVNGYSDGSFKPDNVVTRAEFVTILNNLFGFVEEDTNIFTDISEDDWFYSNVNKGATAGIIMGSNGLFRPQDKITRQEAAVVLARAFKLSAENEYAYTQFNDRNTISEWAIQSVNALVESNYIKGRGNSELDPLANLTRAEALTLISNIAGDIIQQPTTVTGTYEGNLLVNESDVVIKDTVIKGNLYLTQGIGDGDITLDNITVEGELVVLGGGENSIRINNSNIVGKVIVLKIDGKVRIVAEGDTILDEVTMMSGGKLVGKFGNVEVIELGSGDELLLEGDFEEVSIEAEIGSIVVENGSVGTLSATGDVDITVADTGKLGILNVEEADTVLLNGNFGEINVNGLIGDLSLENGTVGSMKVSDEAGGTVIKLGGEVVVKTMALDAAVEVSGTGNIKEAIVNEEGSSFEQAPEDVSGSADAISVGDGDVVDIDHPSSSGSSSGGGSARPSTVEVAVAFTSGTDGSKTLRLPVDADADGYEIGKVFLEYIVDKFDIFYDDIEDTMLGNEEMFIIEGLKFFEYAKAEDLDGTIYSSVPLKSGDEYTDAEKKAMLKAVLSATADNIIDTNNVVKKDLIEIAEAVDFSTIKYDGYNFKSIEIKKDDDRLVMYTKGSDKDDFISAVMDPLVNITPTTTFKYEMIIILDDGKDTGRTSTFETLK